MSSRGILLVSTAEIDSFCSCLKEIHRLNTTPFNNLTELFREYILAGCQMFQMSNGSIADCGDGKWSIVDYHFGSEELSPRSFESGDTIAELLSREGKTIIFSRHSDAPESKSSCAMLKDYKIQKYIGVPISYGNSCKKVLEFYDNTEDEVNLAEHYTEIVELMAMDDEDLIFLWKEEKSDGEIAEARLIELYKAFYRAKLYGLLLECSLKLLKIRPNQHNRLYAVALAAYKHGDTNLAIDYGERLRLRSPSHLKNLILLAKIYCDNCELKKFSKFMEEINALAPENPGYLKLKKYTEGR